MSNAARFHGDRTSALPASGEPPVTFRPLRDATDYAGMAAVRSGSIDHDRIDLQCAREGIPTVADLAGMFPLDEMRNHPDLRLAVAEDVIVGYAHVCWRWTETSGERVYLHLGYVLPAWRSRGIGTSLLQWSQDRIARIADEEQPDGVMSLASNASTTEVESTSLLLEHGYHIVRELTDMVANLDGDLDVLPVPDDIELRPLTPDHFPLIYAAYKDAVAPMFTTTVMTDEDYAEFVSDNLAFDDFDPTLCHVAWVGDELVGYTLCREHGGVGVLGEVGVRQAWQRRGIGRYLLQRSLHTFNERGFSSARLFTDAANGLGARSLYESVGFQEVKRHQLFRKPMPR